MQNIKIYYFSALIIKSIQLKRLIYFLNFAQYIDPKRFLLLLARLHEVHRAIVVTSVVRVYVYVYVCVRVRVTLSVKVF